MADAAALAVRYYSIADVVRGAGGAAVDRLQLGRLALLGAGEDAARGDPAVGEADVVGAAVERHAVGLQALGLELVALDLLDQP
jgi:hypothetical protein